MDARSKELMLETEKFLNFAFFGTPCNLENIKRMEEIFDLILEANRSRWRVKIEAEFDGIRYLFDHKPYVLEQHITITVDK